jgi:deazaflavin-dependent oxidoreductase (nitroreductase family)
MRDAHGFPLIFWRVMSWFNHRLFSRYGPKNRMASKILVLTTIGRKSGLTRPTPLQFEEIDGVYYVASARGEKADWYRNLMACPQVNVQVMDNSFSTLAKPMTDPGQIADFLELRLIKHPRFMGILLRLEGLPHKYSRSDLEEFAKRLAIVVLSPGNP